MALFPALQASDGFVITPSDSADVASDANNVEGARFVFLHNPSPGGSVRVLFAGTKGDAPVAKTIYIEQGAVFPAAIRRVYATAPVPPSGLIGLFGGNK